MTTLYVVLMGLVALAPSPDGKEMWVFMPNAIGPQNSSDNHVIPSHETALFYLKPGVVNGFDEFESLETFEKLGLVPPKGKFEVAAWPVSYDDLSINKLVNEPLTYQDGACKGAPKANNAKWFCWVLRLKTIVPASAQIAPDLQFPNGLHAGSIVRTRLKLKSGQLYPAHFSGNDYGDVTRSPVFKFGPVHIGAPSGGHEQALADVVVLEAKVQADEVEFVAQKFGGGPERKLVLRGLDDGTGHGNHVIVVGLFNVMKTFAPNHPAMSDPIMRHFEVYYGLSRQPPAPTKRPIPIMSSHARKRRTPLRLAPAFDWLSSVFGGIQRPICSTVSFTTSP